MREVKPLDCYTNLNSTAKGDRLNEENSKKCLYHKMTLFSSSVAECLM